MANILLLNPPHPDGKGFTREGRCTQEAGVWGTQWPPVSLATAAAFLEKDGHAVKVFDCPAVGIGRAGVANALADFQPGLVFWATSTPTLDNDLDLGRFIKGFLPNAVTGVFGTHVTVDPELGLKSPHVDAVIRGEPEETIREICLHGQDGWRDVDGLSRRDLKRGDVRHNPDRKLLDPEKIPAPAWHTLDITPYRLPLKGAPFLIVAPHTRVPLSLQFLYRPPLLRQAVAKAAGGKRGGRN